MKTKSSFTNVVVVVLAACLVRVAMMLWSWSGYFHLPQYGMSKMYFRQGYAMAAGYGYIAATGEARDHLIDLYNRVTDKGVRVTPETAGPLPRDEWYPETLHPPGFAWTICMVHRLLGIRADEPMQILGLLGDVVAAGLVFWIGSVCFSKRAGFLAGMAYALFLPLAYQSASSREPTGYLGVFLVAALACAVKALRTDRGRRIAWMVAAGVLVGLGSYLRPDYMLLPVFIGAGLWACTRRFFRSAALAVVMQLVVLAVLSPWAYRNYQAHGRCIFTSSGVGATLITGLGEFDNPWGFGGSDVDRHREAIAQGLPDAWCPEADLYFRDLFVRSVKDKPMAYLGAVVRRLPMALATPFQTGLDNPLKTERFPQNRQKGLDRYAVLTSKLAYFLGAYWDCLLSAAVMFAALLCAVFMLVRERRQAGLIFLLLSPHIYGLASHLLTHFEPRFVSPSAFCWLFGLGYVLARGWKRAEVKAEVPTPLLAVETA